jgi:plastocyanin
MVPGKLRWLLLIAPATLLLAALAAACGGGGSSSAGVVSGKTPTATGNSGASGSSATAVANQDAAAEIDQDNLTFKPNKVTVKVGEKVRVKNSESAIHTVNINGKNISGNMKQGDQLYWTAPKAGNYKVSCDYHPQMSATITVQ